MIPLKYFLSVVCLFSLLSPLALARDSSPSLDMAGVLFQQGRYNDAAREYRRVIRTNPMDQYAYLGLSQALKAQGNLSDAQETLQTLIGLYPTFAPAYYNLGGILEAKGDMAGARLAYQQFIHYSNGKIPSDPEVMIKLRRMGLV